MALRSLFGARHRTTALIGVASLLITAVFFPPFQTPLAAAVRAQARADTSDTLHLADLQSQFESIAVRAAPAIVAISAVDTPVNSDAMRAQDLNPEKLAALLDNVDRIVGTGFIFDSDGYIATNDHVVGKAEQIWVTTDDSRVYPAIVVGTDPRSDLAVLKIPASRLPVLRFAKSDEVQRGQWALTLGNPYGLASEGTLSLSIGVVSATGRSLPHLSGKEDRLYSDLIQTSAQINPGNSGGPLLDMSGDVIGINSAVILPQKNTNGIGFAIAASSRVRQVLDNLKQGREVLYAYLGARVGTPTADECKEAGIAGAAGGRIDLVERNSPAEAAHLRPGDVVVQFNGENVRDGDHLVRIVGASPVDQPVSARVARGGVEKRFTVSLRRRPTPAAAVTRQTQRMRWRGALLGPIPPTADFPAARRPQGLMVFAIDPASSLAKQGITQGSVIASVAGKRVSDLETLQALLNATPADRCVVRVSESPALASVRE